MISISKLLYDLDAEGDGGRPASPLLPFSFPLPSVPRPRWMATRR